MILGGLLICERLKSTVFVGRPCKPHCGVILTGPFVSLQYLDLVNVAKEK